MAAGLISWPVAVCSAFAALTASPDTGRDCSAGPWVQLRARSTGRHSLTARERLGRLMSASPFGRRTRVYADVARARRRDSAERGGQRSGDRLGVLLVPGLVRALDEDAHL